MADQCSRSSYESDNVPWPKRAALRAMCTTIGQELNALYQVPQGANAALGYDVEELDVEP